jgi:hypothetical protein
MAGRDAPQIGEFTGGAAVTLAAPAGADTLASYAVTIQNEVTGPGLTEGYGGAVFNALELAAS